ncbi:hypothetical protein LEP1GSC188_4374 [Leptospira weilii serovar Topaz str. LT2116]|uniref:Uncharacterized protein n=1 Tax=Leptospira weilii serovar Topaz str. LT2116 TaxID=1088540 RepID=M3FUF1_9LEPT|nr:hypothetical protein LEP1GSC188_4374 [Leptospira weilii serovar Topaz str. LT2116]
MKSGIRFKISLGEKGKNAIFIRWIRYASFCLSFGLKKIEKQYGNVRGRIYSFWI